MWIRLVGIDLSQFGDLLRPAGSADRNAPIMFMICRRAASSRCTGRPPQLAH